MTNNGGIKPTNSSPREVSPAGGPQGAEVPLTNMPALKQRKTATHPAASTPSSDRIKTLKDAVDPDKLGGEANLDHDAASSSLLPSEQTQNKQRTGPSAGNVLRERPSDADVRLKWTWQGWEKTANTLQDLANEPGLSDAERVAIDRDLRLTEELVLTLQGKELTDDSLDAKDARSFMQEVLSLRYGRRHMSPGFRPGQTEENVYAEKRAKAIRFIRANRPSLGVAEDALEEIEDLYTDILNEPRLAPAMSTEQRKRLGRDLETLHDLIVVGKTNGWLPKAGQSVPDPRSQRYMEDKIRRFAASISDHVNEILTTKNDREDDATLNQLRDERGQQARDAKIFLSAAANSYIPPGTAPSVVVARQQIADLLVEAHKGGRRRGPGRGREIMDSLPPGYIAGLLARGVTIDDVARRLTRCADLLHVSESGFREGTGRFAFLKEGLWKGIRFSNGRALSSWQAAQVRRSVAMLVLAGAAKPDIRRVRDSLVSELRTASGRIGTKGKQNVEGSVSFFLWDQQSTYSLSNYQQEIERTVANRGFAERERWLPLTNLHTVMDNLSTVLLDPGRPVTDALKVFDHDMKALGANPTADPDAVDEGNDVLFSDVAADPLPPNTASTPSRLTGPLPGIDQPEHRYAHLLKPAVDESEDD